MFHEDLALDNILKKIESDAQKEIEEINKKARQEITKLNAEANKERGSLQNKLNSELEKERTKYLENAKNEIDSRIKGNILQKKQELLDSFYERILKKITELPEEDYINFLVSLLQKLPKLDGGELLCPEKDKNTINKALSKSKQSCKLSNKHIKGSGGFILRAKDIEIDNTLETLVKQLREDTIIDVGKILFGK